MRQIEQLKKTLTKIDSRGYKAYKDIKGSYITDDYVITVQHVQRDPFASPSIILLNIEDHGYPVSLYNNKIRRIALEDFLGRKFQQSLKLVDHMPTGSGKSGEIRIAAGGQEILERTSVNLTPEYLQFRFTIGLPARGRRILGKGAIEIFFRTIPQVVNLLLYKNQEQHLLKNHVDTSEDASFIREQLKELDIMAFLADGAVLPRKSGISKKPLNNAIRLNSPESLSQIIKTPNNGKIEGLGIPVGVTVVVGGGYHGKSTLLNAIELGVYNHIPGDGREMVITNETAAKIRAEDGRSIIKTDISSFIHDPPLALNTQQFSTENASGSTSQAANIVEAIEAGSKLLLFDEDTCATNFMIRDQRMQKLVKKDKEPITPFIDRVQELYQDFDISTILVMGGSGDYFDVADTVLMMDHYQPHDLTLNALKVAQELPTSRKVESRSKFSYHNRYPLRESINPYRGKKIKMDSKGKDIILLGRDIIDLSQLEQLIDSGQTRAISYALYYASRLMDGERTIKDILAHLEEDLASEGLDVLPPSGRLNPHNISGFRRYEFSAALNRLRSLKIK